MLRHDANDGLGLRWFETIMMTLSGPLLGLAVHPMDPCWLDSDVPWLLLLPLWCGARHGSRQALVSSGLLAALALAHGLWSAELEIELWASWSLAALALGMVAGMYRDLSGELQRVRAQVSRLSERLLHAQYAGQLAALPVQLSTAQASAVVRLRKRLPRFTSRQALAEAVLETFARQTGVKAASWHWAEPGRLLSRALTVLDGAVARPTLQALLLRAAKTRRVVTAVVGAGAGEVLAAVPVLTSRQELVAVVALSELPLAALTSEQLSLVLTVSSELGDTLRDSLRALPAKRREQPRSAPSSLVPPAPLGHRSAFAIKGNQLARPANEQAN